MVYSVLKTLFLAIHVLFMIGAFGALLYYQIGLPEADRNDEERSSRLGRLGNLLIVIGLVAGMAAYGLTMRISGDVNHAAVGTKFFILLGVGGCIGMSTSMLRRGRPGSASAQRIIAMFLIAVAAYIGVWL